MDVSRTESVRIRYNQIRCNQIRCNQIRCNQIRYNQLAPVRTGCGAHWLA
jgi:hypothetical protein